MWAEKFQSFTAPSPRWPMLKSFTVLLKFKLFEVEMKQFFFYWMIGFTVHLLKPGPPWHWEFKQITTAGATTAAVTETVWGSMSRWSANFYQNEIQRRQKHKLRSLKSLSFRFSQPMASLQRTMAAIDYIRSIIGDGDRKRSQFLVLGLTPWHGTIFSIFRTNCAIACGTRAYMLWGFFCGICAGEMASEIHEI